MSALDKAVEELDAKRAKDDAARRARQDAASAFLKEFFDADLVPSRAQAYAAILCGATGWVLADDPALTKHPALAQAINARLDPDSWAALAKS